MSNVPRPRTLAPALPAAVALTEAITPQRLAQSVALVAITRAGARMAARVAVALPGSRVYCTARWASQAGEAASPLAPGLSAEVARLFRTHDALVVFAAVGVAVRLVAPCLGDKTLDPAVIAVDDAGRYAISVLGGHVGGGNALTARVAGILGAQAVITTASESHGLPAVDLLGQRWGWRLENRAAAKAVSAALVNGQPVGMAQEAGEREWWPLDAPTLSAYNTLDDLAASALPAIVVTDRLMPGALAEPARQWLMCRPRTLVLGVGASSGVPAAEIDSLARSAVAEAELAWASVGGVATLDRKLTEPGIVEFAAQHGLPVRGYTAAELAAVDVPHPSSEVQRHVATASVCEAAALLASDGGHLVVAKRKSARATVAIARRLAIDDGERSTAGVESR